MASFHSEVIEIKSIEKSYKLGQGKLKVLKGINLQVERGEMLSIMGSSGSGKSTFLNVLGILDNYDNGTYHFNGELIKDLSEKRAAMFRSKHIGFVFQSFNLVTFKNAMENVALPLYYQGIKRKKRNAKALEYLERVGLRDWASHMPNELSGGQKQRVAIARALISNPDLILADEPTGALDSTTSNEIMAVLKEVNAQGVTVVIVTHETDIAAMTDRLVNLKDGLILNDDKLIRSV